MNWNRPFQLFFDFAAAPYRRLQRQGETEYVTVEVFADESHRMPDRERWSSLLNGTSIFRQPEESWESMVVRLSRAVKTAGGEVSIVTAECDAAPYFFHVSDLKISKVRVQVGSSKIRFRGQVQSHVLTRRRFRCPSSSEFSDAARYVSWNSDRIEL